VGFGGLGVFGEGLFVGRFFLCWVFFWVVFICVFVATARLLSTHPVAGGFAVGERWRPGEAAVERWGRPPRNATSACATSWIATMISSVRHPQHHTC